MDYTKHFIDKLVAEVQTMEEIGGPDSLEQYIAVLTAVKLEIERRITVATERMLTEEVIASHIDEQPEKYWKNVADLERKGCNEQFDDGGMFGPTEYDSED
jgi:hypothetical protein